MYNERNKDHVVNSHENKENNYEKLLLIIEMVRCLAERFDDSNIMQNCDRLMSYGLMDCKDVQVELNLFFFFIDICFL